MQEPGERSGVGRFHAARESLGDLLQGPRVAVGIGERCSAEVRAALWVDARHGALARFVVPDLADVDAAADQVVTGRLDVLDDQEQALQRAGLHRRRPLPELDRRRRARWGELHGPRARGGFEVDVEPPPEALVEGLGAVDVGDRHCRDLEARRDRRAAGRLRRGLVAQLRTAHGDLLGRVDCEFIAPAPRSRPWDHWSWPRDLRGMRNANAHLERRGGWCDPGHPPGWRRHRSTSATTSATSTGPETSMITPSGLTWRAACWLTTAVLPTAACTTTS